jgi:serine/threonine protein phosphatase PrpC
MQWGSDFSTEGTAAADQVATVVLSQVDQKKSSGEWGSPPAEGGEFMESPPIRLGGVEGRRNSSGLSIDTSPPSLESPSEPSKAFKKRTPEEKPQASPATEQASLAQKKKRPTPLIVVEGTEAGPAHASTTVVTGPYLNKVDLNELALEDIIFEGHTVYGIQSSKGKRRYMEDTCCAFENIDGCGTEVSHIACQLFFEFTKSNYLSGCLTLHNMLQAYYGVFDGHGGRRAADFARDNLYDFISSDKGFGTNISEALGAAFLKVWPSLPYCHPRHLAYYCTITPSATWQADRKFVELAEAEELRDGTTAVAAYVRDGRLWVANVGDSRAVLSRRGVAVALSEDHRPSDPGEQARIENNGGTVLHMGSWRVEVHDLC